MQVEVLAWFWQVLLAQGHLILCLWVGLLQNLVNTHLATLRLELSSLLN